MAIAMQARCLIPPDSSCGYIRATAADSPTSARKAADTPFLFAAGEAHPDHAQDRLSQGRFARAGSAGQPETFTRHQDEADIVDRLHLALRVIEADTPALNLPDRLAHPLLSACTIAPAKC